MYFRVDFFIMRFFLLVSFSVLFIHSCANKRNILYFQEIDTANITLNYDEYLIQKNDILKIDIGSENPEALLPFEKNAFISNNNISNREILLFNGNQVDSKGNIYLPVIGEINAEGVSIPDLRKIIYDKIIESKYLINPTIDVKILNSHFTILGEVNRPGKYDYIDNNFNILEAIGMAGDLTINGRRNDIKIIRFNENSRIVFNIDLTKAESVFSTNYQIKSGDIVVVNPNSSRVKNAGIIGNSGTLLSLLSFLLSSIIVLSR